MENQKGPLARFVPFGIVVLAVAVLPLFMPYVVATEIWIFALMACSFNLLLGYSGLLSFGQATFMGVGGYTAGLLALHWGLSLIPLFILGAVSAGLSAVLLGYFCIQRRAIYFVMLSFAFNVMIYYIAYQWTSLTGGEDGLIGLPRPNLTIGGWEILNLDSPRAYYYFSGVIFLLCFAGLRYFVQTPMGSILVGVRENEGRMNAIGYNVRNYLWICFIVAGFFSGVAGVQYALLFRQVPLDLIAWMTSGNVVFMTVVGGIGNLFGPVLGAGLFIWLSELISPIWARWPLIFGCVFIAVIMFFSGGLIEAGGRLWEKLRGTR